MTVDLLHALSAPFVLMTNPSSVAEYRTTTLRRRRAAAASPVIAVTGLNAVEQVDARPFLKWAGGKKRLLSRILEHVPERFRNYHEPFLGGGAAFFAVQERARGTCYLADLNEELINTWQIVRDHPARFLTALEEYRGKDTEDEYYAIREQSPRGRIARAARFTYLNQTAWNGLWRVNRWGVFNVPWGARHFRGLSRGHVRAVSDVLQEVSIEPVDFRVSLQRARAGDFVYLDPPYLPVSDTSKFSGYTERRFRAHDLAELAECCRELSSRGVNWVLSNRHNEMIEKLFGHARILTLTTRRSVAAQNRRDVQPADSPEAIVIGGPDA